MPKIIIPTPDKDPHPGSGFCEVCCRQVASSQYPFLEEVKEYWLVTREALLAVAMPVVCTIFALSMYIIALFQGRPKTEIELDAEERERRDWAYLRDEEDQRYWEAFAKQHQRLISLAVPSSDVPGYSEYEQKVEDMKAFVQRAEQGYESPFGLAKETDDLCQLRADLARRPNQ